MHRHEWELIDKTIIPGHNFKNLKTRSYEDTRVAMDAMRDKVVHVFKCPCGKVKVVKN